MHLRLLLVAISGVALAGCTCGKASGADAGHGVDAGPPFVDAGQDAGPSDAGRIDSGVQDAGRPELTVRALLPPRGSSGGGTTVLLSGSGFLAGIATTGSIAKPLTALKFGSNSVLDFQIIDDQTIELRTPPGLAGPTPITFTNPNGHLVCSSCFTYYDELVVTGLSPAEGPVEGGTPVTVTGQGFTAATQVLFGGLSSPAITVTSATQLTAVTPRGAAPGLVDVAVYDKNGVSTQRRAFTYFSSPAITALAPLTGPLDGGTSVTLAGSGFTGATEVRFGTQAATSVAVASDGELTAVTPAVSSAGAVDLRITTPHGSWTSTGAFTYVDPAGSFAAFAVYPHVLTEGASVTLTGQALDQGALTVSLGGVPALVGARTSSTAQLTVPPRGSAPRRSDLAATSGTTLTIPAAVTWKLALTSLTPASGPSAGGTPENATGTALPPQVEVRLGALQATAPVVTGETALSFTTPAGSGGSPSALVVTEQGDPENQATLPGAFTYLEPLALGRVQPERGAIAGGTLITVFGAGFGDSTTVSFGATRAKDLKVLDSHTLTCRTPKANVGVVNVTVQRLAAHDTLVGGFSFVDPRSISGGLSGGPLVGTLNVTVLDGSSFGAPLPMATVLLGTDPATPFQGQTDSRGQITFSDPALVQAQLVTAYLDGYQATTVSAVNAENLTVFLGRTGGGDNSPFPPSGGGGSGSSGPSFISGKVTGFKSPRPLAAGEHLEARVFVAQGSLFSGPPFGGAPYKGQDTWQVTADGAGYLVNTGPGLHAVYAILGIASTAAQTFVPVTMGVRRGVATSADNPAVGQDVVLDLQLDQSVGVVIDSPLRLPDDALDGGLAAAVNNVYAWLDLGAEGFIPNPNNFASGLGNTTSIASTSAALTMPNFPLLDGSNFIFLNSARGASSYPVSYYFRRQNGPLAAGVSIGPMLPAPRLTEPAETFTGTIAWAVDPGGVPDLHDVELFLSTPAGSSNVWSVVLPGNQTQVVLPQPVVAGLTARAQGGTLSLVIYSSRSPKFTYSQWTYDVLSGSSWSAFTVVVSKNFKAP